MEKVGKSWKKLEKVGKSWKKLEKVGKSSKRVEKSWKSWKIFKKVGKVGKKLEKVTILTTTYILSNLIYFISSSFIPSLLSSHSIHFSPTIYPFPSLCSIGHNWVLKIFLMKTASLFIFCIIYNRSKHLPSFYEVHFFAKKYQFRGFRIIFCNFRKNF